jgi:hypothetical protein
LFIASCSSAPPQGVFGRRSPGRLQHGLLPLDFILGGSQPSALPLDLADPTDRDVLVRFEVSDVFIEADLQTPHEGFSQNAGRQGSLEERGEDRDYVKGERGSHVTPRRKAL